MSQEKSPYMASVETHVGGRVENQDYAAEVETPLGKLVLICDGMGGAKGGALASEIAALAVIGSLKQANLNITPLTLLRQAVEAANSAVFGRSKADPSLRGMGTTIAALLIGNNNQAFVAHVGDSRVYQINRGKLIFRTKDHSLVQEMVDRGQIKAEEARLHPDSNRITRALGIREQVEVEVNLLIVKPNDIFVLTSDGIHGEIDDKDILRTVKKAKRAFDVSHELAKIASNNGQVSKQGKHDNLTVATVALKSNNFGRVDRILQYNIILVICLLITGFIFYYVYTRSDSPGKSTPASQPPTSNTFSLPSNYIDSLAHYCKLYKTQNKYGLFESTIVVDSDDKKNTISKYIDLRDAQNCSFKGRIITNTSSDTASVNRGINNDMEYIKSRIDTLRKSLKNNNN